MVEDAVVTVDAGVAVITLTDLFVVIMVVCLIALVSKNSVIVRSVRRQTFFIVS